MKKSPVVITEPAAVAALKEIYQNNGPGKLKWDFSIPGQVTAKDGRLKARDGALTGLDLNKAALVGVLKLHGLETLTVLRADQNIMADGNGLCGFDLEDLPGLQELTLVENPISDLHLANLPGLTKLSLSANELSDIGPLAKLTSLTDLELDCNELSDIGPLAELTALTTLDLSNNEIADLAPLAKLTGLTKLYLSYNLITDLSPLGGLTALEELFLEGNEAISGLGPLTGLTALFALSIPENLAGDLGPLAASLKNLHYFSCSLEHRRPPGEKIECRQAAEHGFPRAQYDLGVAYYYGKGAKKDKAEAARWFRLAAEQGHAEAQFRLGLAYRRGEGVEVDTAESAKWWRLAAEQGHGEAQFRLGLVHDFGDGVEEDKTEAVKLYRLAAVQGHPVAQFPLRYLLDDGVEEDQAYPQELIDKINEATDLVELISRYVALKRAGSVYKGLCPFHKEKTPSFAVNPQRHRFNCFGCGQGGGAARFLMLVEGLSFPKALAELARRAGISLPDPAGRRDETNRAGLFQVMERAQDFYSDRLWSAEGASARRYLTEERGLGRAVIEAFGLGLAPEGWEDLRRHLAREGFSDQTAAQAGLIKLGKTGRFYDFFRGRIMLPIADAQGQVLAFGGRVLPGGNTTAKFLNSGETPLYTKGRHLFGLNRARPFSRTAGMVYLVEGYLDVISLAQAGINEAVAALGTALTERQIGLLKSLSVPVYLLFDGDAAGRNVPVKNLPAFLNADLEARVVTLPLMDSGEAHDPDTFVRAFGAGALTALSQNAPEIFNNWVEELQRKFPDSGGVQAQLRRLGEAREILGRLTDPAKRRIVRHRLAELLNIGAGDLEDDGRA